MSDTKNTEFVRETAVFVVSGAFGLVAVGLVWAALVFIVQNPVVIPVGIIFTLGGAVGLTWWRSPIKPT